MATALIVQGSAIGNDGHGQVVQAVLVPSTATENLTYTTSAESLAFEEDTRTVTVAVSAAAYLKFGKSGVVASTGNNGFDAWQPANSVVTYVIDKRHIDRVAVYDGTS